MSEVLDFDTLKEKAFETANNHGWHDREQTDEVSLMLIITEVAEAVNADRKGKCADKDKFLASLKSDDDGEMFSMLFNQYVKDTFEDELSDIIIRCMDLGRMRFCSFDGVNEEVERLSVSVDRIPSFPVLAYYICQDITFPSYDLEDRLQNVVIQVLSYCRLRNIDIASFVDLKMRYNEMRSYKHGGKKY